MLLQHEVRTTPNGGFREGAKRSCPFACAFHAQRASQLTQPPPLPALQNGPENRHWSDLRQVRRTYSPYRNCFVGGVEVYSDLGKMSPRISIYHDPHPPYPPPLSMKTQDFSTTKPPSPPHTLPIRCAPSPLIFLKQYAFCRILFLN